MKVGKASVSTMEINVKSWGQTEAISGFKDGREPQTKECDNF